MFTKASCVSSSTYPGHSLFQESVFVCTVKDFGDAPRIRDIYIETVVDANYSLGFAKVYPFKNAMNGVDILRDPVLPFYERCAANIGRIFTPSTREYSGLAPVHPFEMFLATSHIEHQSIDLRSWTHVQPCEDFYHVICAEFFAPAIRNNSYKSFGKLQEDLDIFLEKYNHDRLYVERFSKKVTRSALFSHAIDISSGGKQAPRVSVGGL
jgi:hypothetical protein